ncbi:hypothetical protein [Arthrobacter oryzae]|uniref:hypothetical protein n=1 Tax=Arthrobacter oryzae TaxID=409290 RepID=UPI003594853E
MPIHIGAALLGHLDVQTTYGYVTVFQEDVIRHSRPTSPAAGRPGHTGPRPPPNGPNSKSTSINAKSSSATVGDHTPPPVNTNMNFPKGNVTEPRTYVRDSGAGGRASGENSPVRGRPSHDAEDSPTMKG